MKYRARWLLPRILQVLIVIAVVFFVAQTLYTHWNEARRYSWHMDPQLAGLSLALLVAALLFQAGMWRLVLQRLGHHISWGKAIYVFFVSNMARYLPGNIWQPLGMVYLAERERVPKTSTALSMAIAMTVSLASGTVVAVALSASLWQTERYHELGMTALVVLGGLLAVHPRIMNKGLALISRLTGRPLAAVSIPFGEVLALTGLATFFWFLWGASFYFLLASVYTAPVSLLGPIIGICALAYVIGFLSFVTPSGLGVREGVLTYLLAQLIPPYLAAVVPLLARLWQIVAELLPAGLVLAMERGGRQH